jgi:hypothetical protein
MNWKIVFKFLFVCFSINSLLLSQNDTTNSKPSSEDPSKLWITLNPILNRMNFKRNSNSLFEIDPLLFETVLHNDSTSAWLRTRMLWNYPIFNKKKDFFTASEMTLPLYHKLMEDNKMSLFYTVIGSIQTAAVGVLAYQHIRKYGFLKKRDD